MKKGKSEKEQEEEVNGQGGKRGRPGPTRGIRTQMLNIFHTQELTVTLTINS